MDSQKCWSNQFRYGSPIPGEINPNSGLQSHAVSVEGEKRKESKPSLGLASYFFSLLSSFCPCLDAISQSDCWISFRRLSHHFLKSDETEIFSPISSLYFYVAPTKFQQSKLHLWFVKENNTTVLF